MLLFNETSVLTPEKTIEYFIHDNRMLAERAFYCLKRVDKSEKAEYNHINI